MIRIVIADDHQIVLDGLCSILLKDNTIKVVGTATNSGDLLNLLKGKKVHIAILDIEMPEQSGIELTRTIQREHPGVKVILLTLYKTSQMVSMAIEAGASGYLLKERGQEELIQAIKQVHSGQTFLGAGVMELLVEGIREPEDPKVTEVELNTTKREKEVLSLIAKGLSVKEIAEKLFIAPTTVISHKQNLFTKAGVKNVKELIAFAYKHGLD